MTELEALLQILKTFDSAIALGIAVWIINLGIKRMDVLQKDYVENTKAVLQQQHDDNRLLMGLVKDLCEGSRQESDIPKVSPNGAEKSG